MTAADAVGGTSVHDTQQLREELSDVSRAADRAFEEAVAPLVPLLLRYFARRVTPTDDAADCTSETLVGLWKHRRRLPNAEGDRRAWAYGIAGRFSRTTGEAACAATSWIKRPVPRQRYRHPPSRTRRSSPPRR
ncbi:MAG: sigma-70 family RNA polymerase sigma factor [Microbacterium sp.]|uniref:RNA polymerase sigma factor n=1 Tax=Microbacterium sp. TaxID=51671 RepID=UPI0019B2F277|nr:sigma-70 family RNA polymerase sigma factor [Microbacterium sp.]